MPRIQIAVKDQVRYREAKHRSGKVPCEVCGEPGRRYVRFYGSRTQVSTSWTDLCDDCARLTRSLLASFLPVALARRHTVDVTRASITAPTRDRKVQRLQIGPSTEDCDHCGDPETTYQIRVVATEWTGELLRSPKDRFRPREPVVVVLCLDDLGPLRKALARALRVREDPAHGTRVAAALGKALGEDEA